MLVLDGHGSHTNDEFLQKCLVNNILPLYIPPHTSHFLQPLDQYYFANLKNMYRDIIDKNIPNKNYNKIDKADFIIYYDMA